MVAAMEPKTIPKAMQICGALTDEAVRNGSIKKVEKRGNIEEPSKDNNDYRGVPRNANPVNARNLTVMACYECSSADHQHVLDEIEQKDEEETVQTKLLLIIGVGVMETNGTKLGLGHSCWEQRKLARIRTL
nr:hypothetical protein [Tanacetum cinerariifolium]